MSLKVMPKTALLPWVERLMADHRVVGPQALQDRYLFGELSSPNELVLDYTQTIIPPKKYLLPPHEELFRFNTAEGTVELLQEAGPTVILGMHTCDLHAVRLLDTVFFSGYVDQHYRARREQTVLVTVECLKPCTEHSFCKSMGTLGVTEGFDLHLTDMGDAYAVDVGTEKGVALLESATGVRDATDADYKRLNQVLSEKWPRFPYRLDSDITDLASLLSVSYDSDLWQELGDRCLGCGACTVVCPTCYCFNVRDEVDFTLSAGVRIREWDGCPLAEFAVVAGGHNFRKTNAARQRHRFFRKGKYQMDSHGLVGCVGCGRCAQACLVHITPVDTFNELARRRIPMTRRQQEALI